MSTEVNNLKGALPTDVVFLLAFAHVDELVKAMFQEIDNLKTKGPSEKDVRDAREALFREYETGMKQKGWLLKLKFEASLFQTQDGSIPGNIHKTVTADIKGNHLFLA
jgi:uncharacterized small protein (DUF1192 family)